MADIDIEDLQSEEGVEVVPGVRLRLRSLADYRQNEQNPVSHTPQNLGAVIESIHKVGAGRSGLASKGKILAGNLTSDAMAEAGIEGIIEVTTDGKQWVMVNREDLTLEQEQQAAYGDQQGAFLAGWELDQMLADVEAGLDLSGIFSEIELDALMIPPEEEWADAIGGLPNGDRSSFQQMTFTLHDEQVETVKEALTTSKGLGDFGDSPNENSNGNALSRICEIFVGEHGQS